MKVLVHIGPEPEWRRNTKTKKWCRSWLRNTGLYYTLCRGHVFAAYTRTWHLFWRDVIKYFVFIFVIGLGTFLQVAIRFHALPHIRAGTE